MQRVEHFFEALLWNSRYIVLLPVVFSLLTAVGLFVLATVDMIALILQVVSYLSPTLDEPARSALRTETISEVIGALDVYLIAALMLLFSLGLYELFVNKIDIAEKSVFAKRLLLFKNFDDFKDRLANVVQVVLIVKFFQQALALKYDSVEYIVLLAFGIALIGVALFLTRKKAFRGNGEDGDYEAAGK